MADTPMTLEEAVAAVKEDIGSQDTADAFDIVLRELHNREAATVTLKALDEQLKESDIILRRSTSADEWAEGDLNKAEEIEVRQWPARQGGYEGLYEIEHPAEADDVISAVARWQEERIRIEALKANPRRHPQQVTAE